MKKNKKAYILIFLIVISLFLFPKKIQANSYSVENMDIQATIEKDGSINIEQKINLMEIITEFILIYHIIYKT